MTTDMSLPMKLLSVRHGVSFRQCLMECINNKELVSNFDRLNGSNLQLRGAPIEVMVDQASGRHEQDMLAFIDFCWDCIFLRFGKV